jgi:hypothetical protein
MCIMESRWGESSVVEWLMAAGRPCPSQVDTITTTVRLHIQWLRCTTSTAAFDDEGPRLARAVRA